MLQAFQMRRRWPFIIKPEAAEMNFKCGCLVLQRMLDCAV